MMVFTSVYLACCIAALSSDPEIASALATPFLIIFFVFAGQFIRIESLPTGSTWVAYISPIRWCFNALMIN